MNFKLKKIKTLVILVTFSIFSIPAISQNDWTTTYLSSVPQSTFHNPAFRPDCKIFIGIPGASSINIGYQNSLAFRDLFYSTNDSTFLDINTITEKLGKNNLIGFDLNEELLTFGFKAGKNYFTWNSTLKFNFRFSFPEDLMAFIQEGNGGFLGEEAQIGGLKLNLNAYNEHAIGYSREITDKLTIGVRAKLLQGIATIQTEKFDLGLFTDTSDYALTLNSALLINASVPKFMDGINISNSEISFDGASDIDEYIDNINFGPTDILELIGSKGNYGYAFDIGATYDLTDNLTLNASILDLGKFNWKNSVRNIHVDGGSFTFDGIDIRPLIVGDTAGMDPQIENLTDSLLNSFDLYTTSDAFSGGLAPKFMVGATYELIEDLKFGAIARAELYNEKLFPAFTLSANKKFGRAMSLSMAYTIATNSYTNLGIGASFNLFPLQLYIVSDQVNSLFYVDDIRRAQVRFGLNLTIGRKKKDKTKD